MHKRAKRAILISVGGLAGVAALVVGLSLSSRAPEKPSAPTLPAEKPKPMVFKRSGAVAPVVEALELVTRPGAARAAMLARRRRCHLCVLVDGAERRYDLDIGQRAESFAGLLEAGFKPAEADTRKALQLYRAVSRRALPDFDEARGDNVLVLACPKAEWPKLALHWPTARSLRR